MENAFEIRSDTPGEVDTFYHWLKDNRPELLKVAGIVPVFEEAGISGMPGKTVIKIVYSGSENIPAGVAQQIIELKKAVDEAGLTLQVKSKRQGFFERIVKLISAKEQ